jgi:DEAD/DEAH box helicase domain-containing protein
MVEVLTKYLKDRFDKDPRKRANVHAYRGGYLPNERRATERALRESDIDCVVSTSALELGVDIGALDVCVLNGYPGTIADTWQRFGRAGRRTQPSLSVLVGTSNPLDQYVLGHPEFFEHATPEQARISPDHMLILYDHVRCAAFELPFKSDEQYAHQDVTDMLRYLEEQGLLIRDDQTWHWVDDSYPANSVSLRSVAEGNFTVIDTTDGASRIIAEVDYAAAPLTLYEGAIYLLQAKPWQVERLDWEGRKAYVKETRAGYFTDAIDYTHLKVLDRFSTDERAHRETGWGEVHLARRVAGYKKIKYYTHENVGYGDVTLPDHEMHTTAVWWQFEMAELVRQFADRFSVLEAVNGAAYALHHAARVLMMCDLRDLGRSVGDADGNPLPELGSPTDPPSEHRINRTLHGIFNPTIFLYDNYPGGIGLSEPLHDQRHDLAQMTADIVRSCRCTVGCPACIGPVVAESIDTDRETRHAEARASPKALGLRLLEMVASQR